MMKKITIVIGIVFGLLGCRKDCPQVATDGFHEMVVQWTGEVEVDGCGWMLFEDGKYYHPVNLPDEFKQDQLEVRVRFTKVELDYYCGDSPVPKSAIRISEINAQPKSIRLLGENDWDKISMDMFNLDTVFIRGDSLHLTVSYSGGCKVHRFELWKLPHTQIDSRQVEVLLSHFSNGDSCEAYLTTRLAFSLIPLRERGKHSVSFLLRGSPIMSSYFGEFTYRY